MTIPDEIPITNPVAVLREEFDDWAVLFNPDTAEAVGINPTGVYIWKQMDGKRNLGAITDSVSEYFDGVPEVVGKEVSDFVKDLSGRGFVGYELEESTL